MMRSSIKDSSKKPEDNSKQLENIRKLGSNKQCFDCGEKGTTYIVMNFGTFVCSRCAGLLRDLTYKVKGIGVCNFNDTELAFLIKMGNDNAKIIWLAKFDPKKEKLPDPKDSELVRKHISMKYKEKRFAVKDPEKIIAGGDLSNLNNKNKTNYKDDSSDSEEEVVMPNVKGIVKEEIIHRGHNQAPSKLVPLNMKGSLNQINYNGPQSSNKDSFSSPNIINGSNINKRNSQSEDSGWANFTTNNNTDINKNVNNNQGGFNFFETGNNVNITNTNTNIIKNTQNTSNTNNLNAFDMFTFTNSTQTKQTENNNSNNNWGNIWDNKEVHSENVNKINENINKQNPFDFNFVNEPVHSQSSNNVQQGHQNFNFNNTNINNNIIPTTNNSQSNLNSINQNLNSLYESNPSTSTNTSNNNNIKKNLDDLDKYLVLEQPNLMTNQPNHNSNSGINNNHLNMSQTNMLGVSNNMSMMPPQMMQQMQMMMMNPQMQNNPQMMQLMQMMMQNMMQSGNNMNTNMNTSMNNLQNMGSVSNTGFSTSQTKNEMGDLNLGMLNLNTASMSQTQIVNNPPQTITKEEDTRNDMFKDIYNYGKQTGGKQHTTGNNMNFNNGIDLNPLNISNQTNQNLGMNQTNQNLGNSTPNLNFQNPQNGSSSSYNPFDFY